jgi:hypothetical protein
VLVVVLLDHGRHHTPRADPVAAHDQRLLGSILVEEGRAERRRVARPELEDMAELDRRLEAQPPSAVRAHVTLLRLSDIGETRPVVAAGLHPAQVPAVAVRTGDVLPRPKCLVRDDLALEPDRSQRPA